MSEQERKPMLLLILRVPGRILLRVSSFIGLKPGWYIFRAISYAMGSLFGYDVRDAAEHPFRIEFSKKKQK